MAKKQVTVSLGFTADTAKAKAQLNDLQRQLNQLSTSQTIKISTGNFDADIKRAIGSVDELRSHLEAATNADTGKLDLTKFKKAMDESGKTLKNYRDDLVALGPEGIKTFMSLGQSIMNAEVPLKRTNKLLTDMWDNLRKTAGWQLSSSTIHGLMGAMQSAYGYAQDLNASLNDIRIVTGQSAEQMEKFAVRANKAAKELSATTLDYTNAALIYYQQGLSDEKVQERTDVTVKMANVTRENAEDVSSYMTAIWNNFDHGAHTLEYYADVMAKLGAETAASTEEIAAGLEKFAAIADTVGLSYEYATAAVATVVDKTRQSADTVGTSFKTIFSRLSSLSLGETLDDGVTLTKYTDALATVGVAALDANGNLRNMDDILDDLGRKWDTLANAEKNALAQTVAGVRQYNNLIAILNNYDAFKDNVNSALGASGTLQNQADIYAESWEAARDRVRAAAEDIYTSLLNDDFFISLLNFGADVLNILDKVIDGLGGLQGILFAVSNLMITFNKESMANGLRDLAHNIKLYTGETEKEIRKIKEDYVINAKKALEGKEDTEYYHQFDLYLNNTTDLQNLLLDASENLTDAQKKQIQLELDRNKVLHENTLELAKQKDLASASETDLTKDVLAKSTKKDLTASGVAAEKEALRELFDTIEATDDNIMEAFDLSKEQLANLDKQARKEKDILYISEQRRGIIEAFAEDMGISTDLAWDLAKAMDNSKKYAEDLEKSEKTIKEHTEGLKNDINKAGQKTVDWADHVMVVADNFTLIGGVISNLQGVLRVLSDDTMSFGDKFVAVSGSVAMLIPMIIKLISAKNKEALINTIIIAQNEIIRLQYKNQGADAAKAAVSVLGLQKGTTSLMEALKGLGSTIVQAIPHFWAIVGALAALAAIFAIVKYNSPEEKLKRANEELEKAKKAVDETKNAYDDLKGSIDNLDSAKKTLEGLKEGTLEWKQAVIEVNQQVLDLIEKYPELAKYVKNINGVYQIDDKGLDSLLSSQMAQVEMMQRNMLGKERDAIIARQNVTKSNLDSKQLPTYTLEANSQRREAVEVTISADEYSKVLKEAEENQAFNEDGTIDFSKMSNQYQYQSDEYKNAINENIKSVNGLTNTLNGLNNELIYFEREIADSWIDSFIPEGEIDKAYRDYMATGMAKIASETREAIASDIEKMDEDEIIAAYAKVTGSTIEEVEKDIENKLYTIEDITNSIIDNAVYSNAYSQLNKNVGDFKTAVGVDNDLLNKIVYSGGDISSYNDLTQDQVTTLVGTDGNGGLLNDKTVVDELTRLYGKDFVTNVKNYLTQEGYQEIASVNREKKFNQKVDATAQELGIDSDALESYVNYLMESEESLKGNREAALAAAKANIQFANGAKKVQGVLGDVEDILRKGNKESWEYHEALAKLAEAASEMLGIEVDTEYVAENWETIKAASEGSQEALDKLQATAAGNWAENFVKTLDPLNNLGEIQFDDAWKTKFQEDVNEVASYLSTLEEPIELDVNGEVAHQSLNDLIKSVNEAAAAGKMSAEEIEKLFGSMGYSPDIKWKVVDGPPETSVNQTDIMLGNHKLFGVKTVTTRTPQVSVPEIADSDGDGTILTPTSGGAPQAPASKTTSTGGGGSKSLKETKTSDDEIDRYHKVKKQIESIGDAFEDLEKKKDRAFDKTDLIKEELGLIKEEIDLQKQYIDEIEKNHKADKSALSKYGAEFDKDGNISNYEEIFQKELDAYNKAVERYNKDGNEKVFEAAEKRYEEFKKSVERYEETNKLLVDENQKLVDLIYKEQDKILEGIQHELEIKITVSEDTKKYLDYLLKKTDYSSFAAAKRVSIYNQQMAETFKQIESQSKAVFDLLDKKGKTDIYDKLINGEVDRKQLQDMGFTDAEIEQIFDSLGEIWDGNLEVLELNKKVAEEIGKAIDEKMAVIDKQIGKMQFLSGLAGKFRDIVNLTGQDVLGVTDELMNGALDAQLKANTNILETSKAKLDELKSDREKVQKAIEEAKARGEDTTELEKQLDDIDERIQQSTNDFMDSWKTALETAAQIFDESMQQAIDRFGTAIAGAAGNLDNLQTLMDRQSEIDDRYLEDYAKIYELTKLNRDITNSIDNTDNIKGKRELMKLQEEINALQESNTEMSQYEVDQLRAKYDLRLAEIALEEAQNAKSQVRMTRDSEGNWSYTYTADQDNVDSAQQNYEDKLYAMQELNSNYIKEMEQQMASIAKQMQDELLSLDKTSADYQERYNEIVAYYNDKLGYYTEQINKALGNNQELYEKDWKDYSEKTGYKLSATENFVTQFSETMLGMSTGFNSALDFQKTFNESSDKLLQESAEAFNKWKTTIDDVCKAAGTSLEGFKDLFNEVVNGDGKDKKGIKDLSKEAADAAKESLENLSTYIDDVLTKIAEVFEEFGKKIKEAKDGTVSISEEQKKKTEDEKKKKDEENKKEKQEKEEKKNDNIPTLTVGNAVSVKEGTRWYYDAQGNGPSGMAKAGTIKYVSPNSPYGYNIDGLGWVKKTDIVGYDTGGYTGRWGNSGRLGILHEKELVLNADDTENFLNGIMTLRDITNLIDLKAKMMSQEGLLGSLIGGAPGIGQNMEQHIEIYAEFPDATYQDEIRDAFQTLINQASQYANRRG